MREIQRSNSSLTAQPQKVDNAPYRCPKFRRPSCPRRRCPNGKPWFLTRWFRRLIPMFPVSATLQFWWPSVAPDTICRKKEMAHIETLRSNASGSDGLSNGRVGRTPSGQPRDNCPCEKYSAAMVRSFCIGHTHDFDSYLTSFTCTPWYVGSPRVQPPWSLSISLGCTLGFVLVTRFAKTG